MPVFDLTVIPFLWTDDPDSTLIARVEGMVADPHNHELLQMTADLLPVREMRVTAHPPVLTSSYFSRDVAHRNPCHRTNGRGPRPLYGDASGCGWQCRSW